MLHDSPLRKRHEAYISAQAEAVRSRQASLSSDQPRPGAAKLADLTMAEVLYVPYALEGRTEPACEIPAAFGEMEAEYAALRRGAGLLDSPQLGTIIVTGEDRRDFLNRLLTQELKDLDASQAKQAFFLSRKGRVDADLLLAELGDRIVMTLDIHQAAPVCEALDGFLFAEDVKVTDATAAHHHIAIDGPKAMEAIALAANMEGFELPEHGATAVMIAGAQAIVTRRDCIGETGIDLIAPFDKAEVIWDALLATDEKISGGKRRIRPVGWYAFNIARIEAGSPIFNIDFGATNLPHESGLLHERVSFTKGCYIGQEVVARLENLGRPKQRLIGVRLPDDHLPVAGSQVFELPQGEGEAKGTMGKQIGVITSSTISPMLGAAPIAFAMIKTASTEPGTTVLVNAEGEQVEATVAALRFWPEGEG